MADEKLVAELAQAEYEAASGIVDAPHLTAPWDQQDQVLRQPWLDRAARVLTWLDQQGRLIPDGWQPDTEWATQWTNRMGSSTTTGRPHSVRSGAERERRDDEHLVTRQLLAGPWERVSEETT